MKILFTGDYLPDYNRTKIIRVGLEKLGHQVAEYPFQKKSSAARMQIQNLAADCDFVFMPSFTHKEVTFVKKIIGSKILIFDPLISRYLTKVFDYKLVSRFSLSALRNYFRDKWPLEAADFVVTDTLAHRKYFHEKYQIPLEKMGVLYIGNDFDEYYPTNGYEGQKPLLVGFYGGFIPLQGTLQILEAARLLKEDPDIRFELIGSGFEYEQAQEYVRVHNLKNVHLPGWASAQELPTRVNNFDIALGIFGTTEKSDMVIPNKVYHYAACARPIITKKSRAIQELFSDGRHLVFVEPTGADIAQAIVRLKQSPSERQRLGQAIYQELRAHWNEIKVAECLLGYFKRVHGSSGV